MSPSEAVKTATRQTRLGKTKDAILTNAVEFEASEKFRKTEKINYALYVSCLVDSANLQICVR